MTAAASATLMSRAVNMVLISFVLV
jgi:hypothetical protein